MSKSAAASYRTDVVIAGGGPVGLFLACCLLQSGIGCRVLERREQRITHSRSLGIHPVSLERFEQINLADAFLKEGIRIRRGLAFSDRGRLGSITFEGCPPPFRFILAVPQYTTERLLEERLRELDADALMRGVRVTGWQESGSAITVHARRDDAPITVEGKYLAGCDGKESLVRERAGIAFEGTTYPDTYLMGDFTDTTVFGSDAAVFLTSEGLVESFPLDHGRRRWVARTGRYRPDATRRDLEQLVERRTGYDLADAENTMLSSFGVQKMLAATLARGRVLLAGDAAHIVSPIGGQGMNLGWLDAWDLCRTLEKVLADRSPEGANGETLLQAYSKRRRAIARKAIRRAELNMRLGRNIRWPRLRNALVRLMLKPPLSGLMARLFTMRKLDRWWI